MELTKLAGDGCYDVDTCPAMYATGQGTVWAVGRNLTIDELGDKVKLGAGEHAVELSVDMVLEAARRLGLELAGR